jgi:hypothetical protein
MGKSHASALNGVIKKRFEKINSVLNCGKYSNNSECSNFGLL